MLSKFSVKKPLTIGVSVVLVLLLGFISFTKITTDLLPSIDLPYVVVVTTYPGASPEKVELSVTKPLEQVLTTTSGVENINSISSENSSVIILEFNKGMNMDSAMIELSGKIDIVKAQLDEEIGTPMLMKMNPDMLPIMVASIDVNNLDIKEVSKLVNDKVIPEFERIDGVASVTATGLIEEQIKVELDGQKIDDINNKILAAVDEKLAETKRQLDYAKVQIEEGKAKLSEESQSKTFEIAENSILLQDGKKQLQDALSSLPETQAELEKQREDLVNKKKILEDLISWQEEQGIEVVEAEIKALEQFNSGIEAIDEGILQIKEQKPGLEAKLEEIINNEKMLEAGKLTLNQELAKASATLATSEAELNRATEEFEKARDEAYKNSGVGDVLTATTISNILKAQNFSMPAGYIKEGDEQYVVKVGEKLESVEELENLLLFNIDVEGVGKVTLNDIASISITDNSNEVYAKINGNDGIILSFQKQSTYSTAEVSKKINETIEKLMKENLDMNITSLEDQGVYIDIVVNSVLNNLILGGILAVVILFIFLKDIKPTIIIAFSIPISLLFALAMMYFSGVTMNIISLAGLALGVGMLVDNSIVVIENIYRLRSQGLSMTKAAVKGATQVSGAIFASTLTTICVFLPIVFTEGISRQLFTDMGLTIAYSLVASLIVALTLVPTMASTMLNKATEKQDKFFDAFVRIYENILRLALKYKAVILIFVIVLFASSTYLAVSKGTTLMPDMDSTQISISLEMDKDATVDDLREMSNTIMDRISTIEDVETVGALQGTGMSMGLIGSGESKTVSLYVILKQDKDLSSIEVSNLIKEKTSDLNCHLSVRSSNMDLSALGGSGLEVIIKGDDLDMLRDIAKDLGEMLKGTEGTTDVSDGLEESSEEVRIIVDKNKAMEQGLTVAQVYQNIALAILSENTATTLSMNSNEYPIILVNGVDNHLKRETLKNHKITVTKDGEEKEITLVDIATVSEEESLLSINRKGQVRTISVTASIDSEYNIGLVSDDFEKKLQAYEVPDGYTIEIGGEKESVDNAFGDLINMILLAIVFIYLIMVAQFQSLLSPFIVLFTIPLAFTGGLIALLITDFELSMISMLGFLVLAGIVVNNGIVFVDYVNQLRLQGIDKREAVVQAGKTRIRPILMTALTTILGLSTLAVGIGMGSDMIQPMAVVTIGGLVYATILTVFVVPIIYDILHRKELKPIIIEDGVNINE